MAKTGMVAVAAVIEREELLRVWPAASFTCAVKANEPETVGVPVIFPEEATSVRPEGSDPERCSSYRVSYLRLQLVWRNRSVVCVPPDREE